MQQHSKAISICFITSLIAGVSTQLSSTAMFIRWSADQGNDYSSEFWNIASRTWQEDGLTLFLIWGAVSLILYFALSRFMSKQETAVKIVSWLIIPLTVIYSFLMYQGFKIYL